jgi:hypothetical protein
MESYSQLYVTEGMLIPTTDMLSMCIRITLTIDPVTDLEIGNDQSVTPGGYVDSVSDMVSMTMAYQDIVGRNIGRIGLGCGITSEEWINNYLIAIAIHG